MKLFDKIIKEIDDTVMPGSRDITDLKDAPWETLFKDSLILKRDSLFELGGGSNPSINLTLVSSNDLNSDKVFLIGKDLNEIKGDVPFGRVSILSSIDIGDSEKAYDAIKDMEFVKYHVFPKGYMARVSSKSRSEQVRVSKEAIDCGISFSSVGKAYIEKYKALPFVKNAHILFITDEDIVKKIIPLENEASEIKKSLTHIYDGLKTDCKNCNFKKICDEVEGIREMHLGKKAK